MAALYPLIACKMAFKEPEDETVIETGLNMEYVVSVINDILTINSSEDGWCYMSFLGLELTKRIPDFDVRNFGYKKLGLFISSCTTYETKSVSSIPDPSVMVYFVRKKNVLTY